MKENGKYFIYSLVIEALTKTNHVIDETRTKRVEAFLSKFGRNLATLSEIPNNNTQEKVKIKKELKMTTKRSIGDLNLLKGKNY